MSENETQEGTYSVRYPDSIDGLNSKTERLYHEVASNPVIDEGEQGSSDAGVVLDDYLCPERKRTMRRDGMRRRLEDAFEAR